MATPPISCVNTAFISGDGTLHTVRYSFTKGSQFRGESPSAIMSKGFLYLGKILTPSCNHSIIFSSKVTAFTALLRPARKDERSLRAHNASRCAGLLKKCSGSEDR